VIGLLFRLAEFFQPVEVNLIAMFGNRLNQDFQIVLLLGNDIQQLFQTRCRQLPKC
jgi:hypothetical protein